MTMKLKAFNPAGDVTAEINVAPDQNMGTWITTGGSLGPIRFVRLYDELGEFIHEWDYGRTVTLRDGESFTIRIKDGTFADVQRGEVSPAPGCQSAQPNRQT